MSLGGAPPSTLADVLRYVVALYVAATPAWAQSTAYATSAMVSANGAVFVCYVAGTSDAGAGPSGTGSQADANGVAWFPLIYVGERYLRQEGATPRIVFVPTTRERWGGILDIGSREVASRLQGCDVYVWGAETLADLDRYDDADARLDDMIAAVFIAGAGRITGGDVVREAETNIATFGEEYRWSFVYARQVPCSDRMEAAAMALSLTSQSPTDPDRPLGGTGMSFEESVVTSNPRET